MGHLVANDREFVHLHHALVTAVDAFVRYEACCGDHVGCHSIANEEDNVLGLSNRSKVADKPLRSGRRSVVVGECRGVLAGFVQGNLPIGFGGDVDECGFLIVECEEV